MRFDLSWRFRVCGKIRPWVANKKRTVGALIAQQAHAPVNSAPVETTGARPRLLILSHAADASSAPHTAPASQRTRAEASPNTCVAQNAVKP